MRIEILPDEVRSVTAVGEVHSGTPLGEVRNEILPDEVRSGTPLGEVRSGIFPDEVQSVALRGEIRSGTPLCELRSEIFPDEAQGVALRGEVRIETLPDEVHIEIPPAQVSMNLWTLSRREVLQVSCKTVLGVGIQADMIFGVLPSRHEAPQVFYRTPFHEVSRAGKDL